MNTFEKLYLDNDFISDPAFKEIFINIKTRNYLCKVISLITKISYEKLFNNIKILYPEHSHNYKNPKRIMDLLFLCDNILINIEGNSEYSKQSKIKNNQYISILKISNSKFLKNIDNIKIIQINLNNYDIYKDNRFASETKFLETTTYKEYPYSEVIYDVSLPLLKRMSYNEVNKLSNDKLMWYLYIFYKRDIKKLEKIYENDMVMKGVIELMDFLNKDLSELLVYDRIKFEKEEAMEIGYDKGIKFGRNEGIKLGRNEGIKFGRNEGIKQGKQSIIQNMIKSNLSKKDILKYTNITEKEYEKYAKMI